MRRFIIILLLGMFQHVSAEASMQTDTFSFVCQGRKYSGFIDQPADVKTSGLIVLIPGSGRTNFAEWHWMHIIREHFVQAGFACFMWDKAGCGKSEGVYDESEPISISVHEAIAAMEELKSRKIPGSDKIGLWGLSRGGWVCPSIIAKYPSIKFWISVSGPVDKENSAYLLERNFRIEGRSKKETKLLVKEWHANYYTVRHGATFEENQKATENLRKDSFYVFLSNGSKPTKEGYLNWQKSFQNGKNFPFDEKSGSLIFFPNFDKTLDSVNCPVLAIFGEKDSQVDWRKTKSMYKKTIGKSPRSSLTIKTFPDGNHIIQKCKTGGMREKLEKFEYCDGYFDTMITWLKENAGG